ncbi:MAG: hypothetical protein OZSIB_3854 [Candidatus Ozemobacter sibiricus]|uniref:Uncharacterized protein n=1 Tax=Candidatus Ozemobacter sibiricus TaxID=2268124 RepID=A0A367ZPB8_9BACT|nr:MAG: hypothetical protein OZSIB_3854 [Candidatus Ozemobacter sibiricus]
MRSSPARLSDQSNPASSPRCKSGHPGGADGEPIDPAAGRGAFGRP